jgi:cysteinyl-tRNA synthetase
MFKRTILRVIYGVGVTSLVAAGLVATPVVADRSLIKSAQSWTYQLKGNVGEIMGTSADVAVIDWDHVRSADTLAKLKKKSSGGRRLVIGYLSIGEAETERSYWARCCRNGAPGWLTSRTQGWSGNYAVRYWDPAWKSIVMSRLDALIDAGLDGVYLDRADTWEIMRGDNKNAKGAMIELVKEVSQRARSRKSSFVVMVQNAEELLVDGSYVAAIDAVAKESLFFGVAGEGRRNSSGDITASVRDLKRAQNSGKTIFVIEYLSGGRIEGVRSEIRAQGFVPFFGPRDLGRQTN